MHIYKALIDAFTVYRIHTNLNKYMYIHFAYTYNTDVAAGTVCMKHSLKDRERRQTEKEQ